MTERTTIDPNGPVSALDEIGIDAGWLGTQSRTIANGQPLWVYTANFLSTRAIRDLAYLVVDGWNVYVQPAGNNAVNIRIKKTHNNERK